jgi:hypothetical protein
VLKWIHFLCLGEINILHLSKCEKCITEIPNELLEAVDQRRPHNTMAKIKWTNEQRQWSTTLHRKLKIDWLIDWLIYWLIDWLIDWLICV